MPPPPPDPRPATVTLTLLLSADGQAVLDPGLTCDPWTTADQLYLASRVSVPLLRGAAEGRLVTRSTGE